MHNQKKHPVDELFARRLHDVEKMPSARAWDELQGKLTKKKDNKKALYFSIAASISFLIVCIIGFNYWNTGDTIAIASTTDTLHTISKNQPTVTKRQIKDSVSIKESGINQRKEEPKMLVRTAQTQQVEKTQQFTHQKADRTQIVQYKDKPVIEVKSAPEQTQIIEEETLIAMVQPSVKPDIKSTTQNVTVVVVEVPETTIAKTEMEDETIEEPAIKKAGKLWQAIKKAKKSEINLDKEAIVAWVKERNNKN